MFEKIKKVNLKIATRIFAVVWMFILIVVMTIVNVRINRDFDWMKWVSNSLILFGITAFGLLIGESSGVDHQKEKPGGLYKRTIVAYDTFMETIDNIISAFPHFYDWYIPKRIERKNIKFLTDGGMHIEKAKAIVKYCSFEDFDDLKNHAIEKEINGEKVYIRKLLEGEIKPVEMVFKGQVKFESSGAAYYLQATAESSGVDEMEVGETIKKERGKSKRRNRIIRFVSGLGISLVIGALTVDELMKGNDAQAWMNLVSRITNLITALFCGYMSGVDDVVMQSKAIENKIIVLKIFKQSYDAHLFPIYDEQEAGKREFEKYQEELEEAKKNVVEPEIVPGSTDNQLPFDPLQIEEKDDEKL